MGIRAQNDNVGRGASREIITADSAICDPRYAAFKDPLVNALLHSRKATQGRIHQSPKWSISVDKICVYIIYIFNYKCGIYQHVTKARHGKPIEKTAASMTSIKCK